MFVIKCFISYALHSDFLKLSHTMSCSVITVPFIVLNTRLIRGVGGINILSTLQSTIQYILLRVCDACIRNTGQGPTCCMRRVSPWRAQSGWSPR